MDKNYRNKISETKNIRTRNIQNSPSDYQETASRRDNNYEPSFNSGLNYHNSSNLSYTGGGGRGVVDSYGKPGKGYYGTSNGVSNALNHNIPEYSAHSVGQITKPTPNSYLSNYNQSYSQMASTETRGISKISSKVEKSGLNFSSFTNYNPDIREETKDDERGYIKSKSRTPFSGLKNIGNTNSVLQAIFHTPMLSHAFLSNSWKKHIQSNHKDVAKSFAILIQEAEKDSYGTSTRDLKYAVSRINPSFSGYEQQDAQEFLRLFLDALHSDVNRVNSKPKYKELDFNTKKSFQENSDEWFNYFKSHDDSLVTDNFTGQILSIIQCNSCGNKSYTFDNFQDLSLSFSRGMRMVEDFSLDRLIEAYLKEEQLVDYFCSKCKKSRGSTQKSILWKLPHILVFHLKRFSYGPTSTRRQKLNYNVRFPVQRLDMTKFVEESKDPSVIDASYRLYAIVNHMGNIYGGHYTSSGNWNRFNDEMVTGISESHINFETRGSSEAYLLFYCRESVIKSASVKL